VRVTYFGHAGMHLRVGSTDVLIDPFVTDNPLAQGAGLREGDLRADYILLTHAHGDHLGDTVAIAQRTGAMVVGQHEVVEYLARAHGITRTHGMNVGGARSFDWGRVTQTYARHSSSFSDGTYGGLAVGYLIEAAGKTIYHSGDTAAFAEMEWIGEHRSIDVAFLPIGDNYTMGPIEAVRAVKMLRPALVVPIHYNTFPAIETDPDAFARLVTAAGFEARVVVAGEELEV
jgi:L-ascorbate metabolism protein UlaG (beta-lactamase superfamily)